MTKRQEATAVSISSGTGASNRAGSHPLSGRGSRCGLRDLKVGYMLALKQNHPRLRLRKRQWLNLSRTMPRLMQGLGKKGARKARMASGVTSEPGWSPGSCSGDTGKRGRHCPHHTDSSRSLSICVRVHSLPLCYLLTFVKKIAVGKCCCNGKSKKCLF